MRTVSIRSDGLPMNTRIRDKETGKLIDDIQRVEFSDFHVNSPKWVAILHRHTGKLNANDDWETYEEQVHIEIGVD